MSRNYKRVGTKLFSEPLARGIFPSSLSLFFSAVTLMSVTNIDNRLEKVASEHRGDCLLEECQFSVILKNLTTRMSTVGIMKTNIARSLFPMAHMKRVSLSMLGYTVHKHLKAFVRNVNKKLKIGRQMSFTRHVISDLIGLIILTFRLLTHTLNDPAISVQ